MNTKKQTLAELITSEMGKPIKESIAEVEKSMSIIDYYAQNAQKQIEEEIIKSRYKSTSVVHQSWGPVLSKE